jgi:hypothetical protein
MVVVSDMVLLCTGQRDLCAFAILPLTVQSGSKTLFWNLMIYLQGWKERPIFGKIRYMNYEGCKRKFNTEGYIANVEKLVSEVRRKGKQNVKLVGKT